MELELGLKLTRVADEFTSDFHLAKDRAGPVFVSRETDTVFILTANLKGYRRRNMKIDINEDGSLIAISGERQVKETVMVGWKVYKNDAEIKAFKKIYRIPDGVILDKIRAKFADDESTLTITMPKKVKGVCGTAIEEVKDTPELVREGSGSLPIADEKMPKEEDGPKHDIDEEVVDRDEGKEQPGEEEKVGPSRPSPSAVEEEKAGEDGPKHDIDEEVADHDEGNEQLAEAEEVSPSPSAGQEENARGGFKMCIPLVAGSTLLLTFVAFVIQMIRSKHQTGRRRD